MIQSADFVAGSPGGKTSCRSWTFGSILFSTVGHSEQVQVLHRGGGFALCSIGAGGVGECFQEELGNWRVGAPPSVATSDAQHPCRDPKYRLGTGL